MNKDFLDRTKLYFGDRADEYLDLIEKPCSQGFFLNTKKAKREDILDIVDFKYWKTDLSDSSFYQDSDSIGKSKAYELGLIYPQEIAASLTTKFINKDNIKTVVDMCAAPGGKSINALNRLNDDVILVSNDYNHQRVSILSSNLERLGLDNVIITNKKCDVLADELENFADLVILDAPCSGEGMVRKYPEIIDNYSIDNIKELSVLQSELLNDAYRMLKGNGQLVYSTCTYALEEDEHQIEKFLELHPDMHLIDLGNGYSSSLKGTIKLSPLNNTEGQFICLMVKDNNSIVTKHKYLKSIKEKLVDEFIKENIDINNYYLYKHNDHYYMSLIPLIDLNYNVMKYGIYVGDVINKRFEPSHSLYRSNILRKIFKHVYDLSDDEYEEYIKGLEIKTNLKNNYYLVTYKGYSLGFGKCSNGQLKNKYPKGLRRN